MLLLDCGGTLLRDGSPVPSAQDTAAPFASYRRLLEEHGLRPTPQEVLSALLAAWEHAAPGGAHPHASASADTYLAFYRAVHADFARRVGATDPALAEAIAEALTAQEHDPAQWEPFPDVLETLPPLAQHYLLVVVSNWNWELPEVLAHCGLAPYLHAVVTSARVGYGKPHPAIFRYALALAGAAPEEALMVGDWYDADVAGARRAGVRAVLLHRRGTPPEVDCPVIRSLAELPALLKRGVPARGL